MSKRADHIIALTKTLTLALSLREREIRFRLLPDGSAVFAHGLNA
jgi:hypothetical protein